MAGNYSTGPGNRFAYDADGTTVLRYSTALGAAGDRRIPWVLSTADKANLNSERFYKSSDTVDDEDGTTYFVFIFPENRDIDGIFWDRASDVFSVPVNGLSGSDDTTNGQDGTWTNIISDISENTDRTYPYYRDDIDVGQATDVSAIRVALSAPVSGGQQYLSTAHIYGQVPLTENPNRIVFIDTAKEPDAVFTRPLDYGDIPRGTSVEGLTSFKLKNNSTTLDAVTVQLTAEDLYLNAGGFFSFSETDGNYQGTLSITQIDAEAELQIYTKRVLTADETLGTQSARLKVDVTSWVAT